jgi:NADPH-dependent 2,4-dienoyl-CoA reductase/sulfur reductase-like enzyme
MLDYHRLLLATGAAPRDLGVPGRQASGIYPLRHAADAENIAPRLQQGADIVIVGGGLIGLEAAAAAISRGCNVTVVEAGPRLMMRAVPAPLSAKIRQYHESKGVRFLFGRQVMGFGEHAGVLNSVSLDDGTTLACSASIMSIGVLPRTELAQRAGLALDNGVAVNCFLQSSDPFIYAAGDASSFKLTSGLRMRLECWKNAEDQGSVVARNMMGGSEPYLPFPWMWSDQFDQTMQIAGIADGAADHVERQCEDGTLLVYHLDDAEKIQAVSGFGSIREVSRGVRGGQLLMERGLQPSLQALQDPNCDLRMFAKAGVA